MSVSCNTHGLYFQHENSCPLCSAEARVAELERLNEAYRERLSPAISCPIEEFLGPVKPCPFCGSEGINLYEGQVECGNCRATAEPGPWQFRDTRRLDTAEARVAELEASEARLREELEEIGCRTDHGDQPEPCPICEIVDRALGVKP